MCTVHTLVPANGLLVNTFQNWVECAILAADTTDFLWVLGSYVLKIVLSVTCDARGQDQCRRIRLAPLQW